MIKVSDTRAEDFLRRVWVALGERRWATGDVLQFASESRLLHIEDYPSLRGQQSALGKVFRTMVGRQFGEFRLVPLYQWNAGRYRCVRVDDSEAVRSTLSPSRSG